MRHCALYLLLSLSLFAAVGCGSSPPPADKSDMPPEVRAEEEKFETEHGAMKPN